MSAPSAPASRVAAAVADLTDPRVERTKHHRLVDILTITLCGVLSGAENWVEIAEWAKVKQAWRALAGSSSCRVAYGVDF